MSRPSPLTRADSHVRPTDLLAEACHERQSVSAPHATDNEANAVAGAEAGRSEAGGGHVVPPASDAPATRPGHRRGEALRPSILHGAALPQPPAAYRLEDLFEKQARQSPNAPALRCNERCMTYAELDEQADRLAARLRMHGLKRGELVAVCIDRSPEVVVALLGILKAGGAYVPLEPTYPSERLTFMLEDSGAKLLLTDEANSRSFSDSAVRMLRVDVRDDTPRCDRSESHHESAAAPSSGDLAYVIYTSGSTGRPKGVAVTHRSAVNTLLDVNARFGIGAGDRVLALSSVSFDLSVWDVFGMLASGGAIVLPEAKLVREPAHWLELIERHEVSVWNSVPAFLEMLVASLSTGDAARLRSLKTVLLSGDWIAVSLPDKIRRWAPLARVISLGGATEAAVWSIYYPIDKVDPTWKSIPYGRPLANQTFYVLDESLRVCPPGVVGELYIGGEGVALGYWNRPELTAEKFLPDPFSDRPDARLYRTGDLGRYLADGDIEFLGRIDHQVKIRGYRIELGEIESALARHPAVAEAAVIARRDRSQAQQLVAYIVPCAGCRVDFNELGAALRHALPEYMRPQRWVALDALPLTANGKVDRQALPEPTREAASDGGRAFSTDTERAVANIWSTIIKAETISAADNFLQLGGDSLAAVRAAVEIAEKLNVKLPVTRLLGEGATLECVAAEIDRLRREPAAAAVVPGRRQSLSASYPLAFQQRQLWALNRFQGNNAAYNVPVAFRLRGTLDEAALRRSVEQVAQRHAALRTVFFENSEGRPAQCVAAAGPAWQVIDLTGVAADTREARLRQELNAQAGRLFDFEHGPLARAALVRLSAEEHVFLFTAHHIVFDGWSIAVLKRELSEFYHAAISDEASSLPDPPLDYADYTAWQAETFSSDGMRRAGAYWKQTLSGKLPVLELPADRVRPPAPTFAGAVYEFEISQSVTAQLRQLGQARGATLYMVLLAALKTLLYRLSGQPDVIVGSPVAGREQSNLQELIGFFVNTLALRTRLSGNPSFGEVVDRVRSTALGAYAHQDYPFLELAKQVAQGRGQGPLFNVNFAMQNVPAAELRLQGIRAEPVSVDTGAAKFDLFFSVTETSAGLSVAVEYASDLFDTATITRWMDHWLSLLAASVQNPETPIDDLPLLSEAERRRVLFDFNANDTQYPSALCIHDLFERQARQTPDAVAVVCAGRQLTYAELDRRSTRLARLLVSLGAGPDTLVGICVERSLEMVVGVLGVLKSGAAYLPLDPSYPADRLQFMLADGGAKLLYTERRLADCLGDHQARVLYAEDEPPPADERIELPRAAPHHLAYVIYTSGSTGKPKGVMLEHRNVVNFLCSFRDLLRVGPQDVMAAVTSLSFDMHVFELFLPLLVGGRIVVVPRETATHGRRLGAMLDQSRATLLQATPITFRLLLAAGWRSKRRMTFVSGGEILDSELAGRLLALDAAVWNCYGPTETTVFSTYHRVEHVAGTLPIGRGIANTQIYVLDPRGNPVPIGVPGEVFIAGDGVARGYLNRPDVNRAKFLTDPFRPGGGRMYRSGDRARWLADGQLDFLGRDDDQVKIRGFRIELEEIEATLARHPAILQAAVVPRRGESGQDHLAAYLVLEPGQAACSNDSLRRHLRETLPDYMVPATFTWLGSMPLTPNGKVNRRELPAECLPRDAAPELRLAPRDDMERRLAAIFEEGFGARPIGVRDDFFDLGGDSLSAAALVAGIADEFGRRLPITVMQRCPTIEKLAELLRDDGVSDGTQYVVELQSGRRRPALFCLPGIHNTLWDWRKLAVKLGGEWPVYGLLPLGTDGLREPHRSVEDMAAHNIQQMRRVRPSGPYHLMGYSLGGTVAYEMAQQLHAAGEQVDFLLLLDAPKRGLPRLVRLLHRTRRSLRSGRVRDDSPTFAAHWQALDEYHARPYAGRVVVMRASVPPPWPTRWIEDDCLGWITLAQQGAELYRVPGDHDSLFQPGHLEVLADKIKSALTRALAAAGATLLTPPAVKLQNVPDTNYAG